MSSKSPKRPKRSESYVGIHFDLHGGPDCTEMGKRVTPEMIEHIVTEVSPDYIQCDCKGHPGYASYPTKVGTPVPGFAKDQLRIWRDVTAKHGVALYMHYSGVIDAKAVQDHPEWARIDENGNPDLQVSSTFGPYVDELLIPQLKELIDDYDVDGVWVDGECWGTAQDYGEEILRAFKEQTGIADVPRKLGDPYYYEFSEFCRQSFRRYLAHYVTEVHKHNPDFQIASNWAYTSFMPEPVTIDVDYISGDYSLQNSVNTARFEGRCLTRQGKPWDLMAWAFSTVFGEWSNSTKSVEQLKQEAAVVVALGGGFQAYFKQKRDGSIQEWEMKLMGEVARFCRARRKICHHAKAVPQIGLIYAGQAFYRQTARLFAPWDAEVDPLRGILQSLLDSQYSVEILMEHHLRGRMAEYPLLVLPEWTYLDPDFREELLDYVREGGKLLVIGPKAVKLFEKELNVKLIEPAPEELAGQSRKRMIPSVQTEVLEYLERGGDFLFIGPRTDGWIRQQYGKKAAKAIDENTPRWIEHNGWLGALRTASWDVELDEGVRPFGKLYGEADTVGPYQPAASITSYGKGELAAVYTNMGERYFHGATNTARDFLAALVRELFPDPIVTVQGSHNVDVVVNKQDGKLAVNLVNTSGPHANREVFVFDQVPPVGPLEITIRVSQKPARVIVEPSGEMLDFVYTDGQIQLILSSLHIHEVLVVE